MPGHRHHLRMIHVRLLRAGHGGPKRTEHESGHDNDADDNRETTHAKAFIRSGPKCHVTDWCVSSASGDAMPMRQNYQIRRNQQADPGSQSGGRIEQIGKPQDIRARPATAFVREFVSV